MSRKGALLATFAVAALAVSAGLVATAGGEAKGAVKVRQLYMSAVEWKGSASVAKEPYPTAPLPAGGGYESCPPGGQECTLKGDTSQ